ncbi:hypothetical protein CCUS01_00358 [Colletotrichum cuscutae]|uniref:Uncharacterized protein n=1 Tax=Colletotrichum cuscutae TaxID=1209917 RepID=A0AAI9VAQ6_9PEZI|nr:hypothetical protein CCUS01_00358 [Colletotrichum cuscutae]
MEPGSDLRRKVVGKEEDPLFNTDQSHRYLQYIQSSVTCKPRKKEEFGRPWLEPIMGDLPSKFMTEAVSKVNHASPALSFTLDMHVWPRRSLKIAHNKQRAKTGNLTRGFTLHNVSHLIPRECCYQFPPRFIGATPTRRDDCIIRRYQREKLVEPGFWASVLAISPKLTSSPSNQDKRSSPLINLMGVPGPNFNVYQSTLDASLRRLLFSLRLPPVGHRFRRWHGKVSDSDIWLPDLSDDAVVLKVSFLLIWFLLEGKLRLLGIRKLALSRTKEKTTQYRWSDYGYLFIETECILKRRLAMERLLRLFGKWMGGKGASGLKLRKLTWQSLLSRRRVGALEERENKIIVDRLLSGQSLGPLGFRALPLTFYSHTWLDPTFWWGAAVCAVLC